MVSDFSRFERRLFLKTPGGGVPAAIFLGPLRPLQSRQKHLCSRCDSHLGQVLDDVLPSTHPRYCMNLVALVSLLVAASSLQSDPVGYWNARG
jgi:SelR domain